MPSFPPFRVNEPNPEGEASPLATLRPHLLTTANLVTTYSLRHRFQGLVSKTSIMHNRAIRSVTRALQVRSTRVAAPVSMFSMTYCLQVSFGIFTTVYTYIYDKSRLDQAYI